MSNPFRTRRSVEGLDARITPSAVFDSPPAFLGLNVAASRFQPVDPCLTASPVFFGAERRRQRGHPRAGGAGRRV